MSKGEVEQIKTTQLSNSSLKTILKKFTQVICPHYKPLLQRKKRPLYGLYIINPTKNLGLIFLLGHTKNFDNSARSFPAWRSA